MRAVNLLQNHDATCPHCWETIGLELDLSVPDQSYVEDCPVCCNSILVSYRSANGVLHELNVDRAD